mgnify:CR=1 FL=1|tara:strand:+ start:904 stop:1626 length:723 start_codon:yes stop_codon:yes gene_type:complete
MNKAIFITVRTGSTRLANKSVLEINSKPTIEYLIERVKDSKATDDIILCTTTLDEDDILCQIAIKNNIKYYKGHPTDKWKRWLGACQAYEVDFFVTADGDDLFYEGGLADLCFLQQIGYDTFINGQGLYNDVYGMDINTLEKICSYSGSSEVEPHNIVDFLQDTDVKITKITNIPDIYKKNDIRMTLDYVEDFEFFKNVIEYFNGKTFGLLEIISYINDNPSVKDINKHLEIQWKENQLI